MYSASAVLLGTSPVYVAFSPYSTVLVPSTAKPSSSKNVTVYLFFVEINLAYTSLFPVMLLKSSIVPFDGALVSGFVYQLSNVYVYSAFACFLGVVPLYVAFSPYSTVLVPNIVSPYSS